LEAATHRLPNGWDFDRDGPWSCSWCDEVIYTALGQQAVAEAKLAALQARASTGDPADRKAAKAELDGILKAHAELHGDALLLEPLIMLNKSGTKCFIVDPMHGLELNLMKTLWKYSFGDRMTDYDRELVAEYLSSINLHLDIRAKGKRDPQQKWFSAAQCDEFVLGSEYFKKAKSPGLIKNVLAICEIIFDKSTVADLSQRCLLRSQSRRPRAKIATLLQSLGDMAPPRSLLGGSTPPTRLTSPSTASREQGGAELRDKEAVLSYVRGKYGNQSEVVIHILTAWEAFGGLFSEWGAVWEGDSDEYRAKRSLRLARAGRDFQAALVSLSNYKQESWYTHAVVWIIWQQFWWFGNTWPLSTISIESRNARIKRCGLRFTS
jgi:hypothetical protein